MQLGKVLPPYFSRISGSLRRARRSLERNHSRRPCLVRQLFSLETRRERRARSVHRCPHRNVPLSLGEVVADGTLQCPYHGWKFDTMERANTSRLSPRPPKRRRVGLGRSPRSNNKDLRGLTLQRLKDPQAMPETVRETDVRILCVRGLLGGHPSRRSRRDHVLDHRECFSCPSHRVFAASRTFSLGEPWHSNYSEGESYARSGHRRIHWGAASHGSHRAGSCLRQAASCSTSIAFFSLRSRKLNTPLAAIRLCRRFRDDATLGSNTYLCCRSVSLAPSAFSHSSLCEAVGIACVSARRDHLGETDAPDSTIWRGQQFASTEIDVLGKHIWRLLKAAERGEPGWKKKSVKSS